jgi:hypothetical protein
MSKAREAAKREAKALENYHSPRWQEHPQQRIVSAPAAQQARATAWTALTTNVVFKFIDNEFLFRNYALEQIANGDNADHFFAFEHGQVTHTLIGHQGHAYLDRLFWPDMDYVSLHDIPDQRGGGPFAFENDIPGIVSLGYDADQFFTVHHN